MDGLREKYNRVATLPRYEERLAETQGVLANIDSDIASLLRKYEREKRDVERMERDGLSAFLLRLVGRYEDKLEKEQQQEIEAKLAYDKAKARRVHLLEEEQNLSKRIYELKAEQATLQAEFDARRKKLAGRATEHCDVVSQMAEAQDAKNAIKHIEVTVRNVIRSLDSARGWATFDMFTRGGILSHIAKYSHLDEAEEAFYTLSAQMKDLAGRLEGMLYLSVPSFNAICRTERMVDFWFDNIFTDMSVKGQISDNLNVVENLERDLHDAYNSLTNRLSELEKQEEEILLSMGCL
ncbi:MAG: hypothetical protein FWB98_09225 [Defluviitaleaceae bacterium]|nr:hypothetical protein [Defluviitaleaceae bacterium]